MYQHLLRDNTAVLVTCDILRLTWKVGIFPRHRRWTRFSWEQGMVRGLGVHWSAGCKVKKAMYSRYLAAHVDLLTSCFVDPQVPEPVSWPNIRQINSEMHIQKCQSSEWQFSEKSNMFEHSECWESHSGRRVDKWSRELSLLYMVLQPPWFLWYQEPAEVGGYQHIIMVTSLHPSNSQAGGYNIMQLRPPLL